MDAESEKIKEEIRKYLGELKPGELVYPGTICINFCIDMKHCYEFLESFLEQKILTSVLKIICPNCKHIDDNTYQTFMELPEKYTCPVCGQDVDTIVESYVIYKKL